jgi:phosphatidylglycerophosphatase A
MEQVESRSLSKWFVTGFGVGYCPIAPGTMGTILGLILFLPFHTAPLLYVLPALAALFGIGVYTTNFSFALFGQKDPSKVVIDEIVAILFVLFLLPISTSPIWWIAGFLLFRLFDITKPIGVREAEHLPGGWGIMADDIVAALYTLVILWVIYYWTI